MVYNTVLAWRNGMKRNGEKSSVSFVFYTGQGSQEPWINQLTSLLTGRFMHCEIVFTESGGSNMACGVWQGENVFFRPKTFGKDCWIWKTIRLPMSDVETMRRFCATQARNKIPFNRSGLIRCTTPFPRPTDGRAWFCSELCVAALQCTGRLRNEVPSSITPTMLFHCLGQLDAYTNASPLVDQRMGRKKLLYSFNSRKVVKGSFIPYSMT
jgi:hypothetical protein